MPDFQVNFTRSIGFEIAVTHDPQWDTLEVWAPDPPGADVLAYYRLITEANNVDDGGFARIFINYEDLRLNGLLGSWVRVVGKATAVQELLADVTPLKVTRSNRILEDETIAVIEYPANPQIPFGFPAEKVSIEHLGIGSAEIFGSYDGQTDHLHVAASGDTMEDTTNLSRGGLANKLYLRASASIGADVRVRASRPDVDRR